MNFPNINYKYWSNKNPYFSNEPLITTILVGLKTAAKGGLIGCALGFGKHELTDEMLRNAIPSNADLVRLIAKEIGSIHNLSCVKDDRLLLIFDLIQGWGGKMGRSPYVRPANAPSRLSNPDILLEYYRKGVNFCFYDDYSGAISAMSNIINVGESFATKHIFFWSKYGPGRKAMPIYDTRIKKLLYVHQRPLSYEIYVRDLVEKAGALQIEAEEVERALFSFSQNYFSNSKLLMPEKVVDATNIDVARQLQEEWLKKRPTAVG